MARTGGLPLPTITDDRVLGEAVIQKSLRFRQGSTTYLTRALGSPTSDNKASISVWVKRTLPGTDNTFFDNYQGTNDRLSISLLSSTDGDALSVYQRDSSGIVCLLTTARVFRDPSAWYHILVAFDTTQGTESNRVKIYVNGTQVTSFSSSTYFSQNHNLRAGSGYTTNIGRYGAGSNYLDGYLAEVNYIDGQQLSPTDVGFTDSQTGIWMPRRYEGTYGNNGFRLDFLDNSSTAALGIDKSPNGNDFTVNNHSVSANLANDSMPDTPTNNFCVLNHKNKTSSFSGKDGGLTFDQTSNDQAITGTFFVTSGKWYWEFYKNSGHNPEIGIATVAETTLSQRSDGFIDGRLAFISNGGNLRTGSSSTASITGSSSGQTGAGWLRIACDMDNKKIWFSDLSGNYFNSGNPATGANPAYDFSSHATADGWAPYICMTTANDGNGYPNFGQFDLNNFSSNIPAGFKTLTSKNLRDELLTAPAMTRPKRHIDTLLYTGTGSSNIVEGLEFSPDMIWVKGRDTNGTEHLIIDSVRGGNKSLTVNANDQESTHGGRSMTFYPNGVRWNSDSNTCNANGEDYVMWCWKAGGAAVSNSDGSITTTISANQEAGFSVVTWTGTGSNSTVGHGLGKAPKFVICKLRDTTTQDWFFMPGEITGDRGKYIKFNTTDGVASDIHTFPPTATTSTVFTVGGEDGGNSSNGNGSKYVAYCWAEIPGYSKFGEYKGNGNANGPYVHLGFRPALLITRRIDSGDHWIIRDNTRNTDNPVYSILNPNSSSSEFGSSGHVQNVDFLSNGFKITGSDSGQNGSTGTYIFLAWAEQPGIPAFTTMINAR